MTDSSSEKEGKRSARDGSPDAVCARFAKGPKTNLVVRELEADEDSSVPYILIEGPPHALRFLGELLIAQSEFSDCGFQLGPRGTGSAIFDRRRSTKGIYIHRLPCNDDARKTKGTKKR